MFIENMKRISEAEEEAVSIRKQAQADVRTLQDQSRRQAAEITETARKQADTRYQQVMRDAELKAEDAFRQTLAAVAEECESMKAKAQAKLPEAIQIIAGKVVNSSGSC